MFKLIAITACLAGCGVEPGSGGSGTGLGSGSGSDADGFTTLVSSSWTLPASTEQYLCVRLTIQADTYISAIKPMSPAGTHHSVLMAGPSDGQPDGTTQCDSTLSRPSIYASGVGTDELDLPDGVAIHLTPGEQLLLNLHLFNATDGEMTGTSGIQIAEVDASDVQHVAGVLLAGKAKGLVVVPDASTQTGTCTTPDGMTMFAAAPHMHLLGTYLTATYTPPGGQPQTLIDQSYSFDAQKYVMQTPEVVTQAGGQYAITCSYFNPSPENVYFGESTTDEMCFALTMVYPVQPNDECTN